MDIGKIEFGPVVMNDIPYTEWPKKEVKFSDIVPVKIYNRGNQPIPEYAHVGDAGMDVRSNINIDIYPNETKLVDTGFNVKIPMGYEIQVRPRSGMSLKTKLRVANSPGTIDTGYVGPVCIICENIGDDPIKINVGDRIAQIVLNKVPVISWQIVTTEEELGDTTRGSNGFGSTGHK